MLPAGTFTEIFGFSNFSPIAVSETVNGEDVPPHVVMATPSLGNQT